MLSYNEDIFYTTTGPWQKPSNAQLHYMKYKDRLSTYVETSLYPGVAISATSAGSQKCIFSGQSGFKRFNKHTADVMVILSQSLH